jgi:hypothetical protein
MRSIFLLTRQEMNTGSIGRSMSRMITQLRNPDQMMQAANSTDKKLAASCSAKKISVKTRQLLVAAKS